MAQLFKIFGTIGLDSKEFDRGIDSASGKGKGFATFMAGAAKTAVTAIATAGAALGGLGLAAIKVGSTYESAMSQVAATMGITADKSNADFLKLSNAAKEMGATTQFSATQAAEALNYMALAGFDADKSVAALPDVLNLAAAGGLDLAYASDLVTDSMSALGLETNELTEFTDQMAKTSQKSNTSVAQLGDGMLVVGGLAKGLAGGTVELSTSLGLLADNGIKGAEGGTKLRNVILALSAPTGTASSMLKSLGVETIDASGNMLSLDNIMGQLNKSLEGMGEAEKAEIINTIFNKQDMAAVNALLGTSADRWDELSSAIEDSEGAAAQMAITMNDNLKGSITILKSSLEGLGIEFYESVDNPVRGVVDNLTTYVGQMAKAFKQDGLEGLITAAGEIVADMVTKITTNAPKLITAAVNLIQSFLKGLIDQAPVIANGAAKLITEFDVGIYKMLPTIVEAAIKLISEFAKAMATQMPILAPVAIDGIMNIAFALLDNIDLLIDAAIALIKGFAEALIAALPVLIEKAPEIIKKLTEALIEFLPELIILGAEIIIALVKGLIENLPALLEAIMEIIKVMIEYWAQLPEKIWQAIMGAIEIFAKWGNEIFAKAREAAINLINVVIEWLAQLPGRIWNAIIGAISYIIQWGLEIYNNARQAAINTINAVIEWMRQLPGRIWDSIVGAISSIADWGRNLVAQGRQAAYDLVSAVIDNVQSLPGRLTDFGRNVIEGFWNGISNARDWLVSKISGFFGGIVDSIKDFFGIKSPSRLFMGFGKMIDEGFAIGILSGGDIIDKAMQDVFGSAAEEYGHFDVTPNISGFDAVGMSVKSFSPDETIPGQKSIQIVQNIYSQAMTPSELMKEAQWQAERAVVFGV